MSEVLKEGCRNAGIPSWQFKRAAATAVMEVEGAYYGKSIQLLKAVTFDAPLSAHGAFVRAMLFSAGLSGLA
ncbi:hypothetical protein [Labrys sp. ZIDIC5]|uniref:hypothetical protein n=1 Tax=Labrys sedimenti TaxID=3106036 RepID=UPI002ACC323A|nr:hypothetical protein [Labrys sp. ZIDIC5]